MNRALSLLVALASIAITIFTVSTAPAQASTHSASWYGNSALNWAENNANGHYYSYGGAGPSSYDCSGLVMTSFKHVGISLPHSTYSMLVSRHLHRIPLSRIHRGVIIFFGSGHVEFATKWWHWSFGAHNSRRLIGWRQWTSYYHPTAAYEVY